MTTTGSRIKKNLPITKPTHGATTLVGPPGFAERMPRGRIGYAGLFTMALLGICDGSAAQGISPAATQSSMSSAEPVAQAQSQAQSDWPPTREQWERMEKDQQVMRQELEKLEKEHADAVVASTQAQTQPSAQGMAQAPVPSPGGGNEGTISSGLRQNNVGLTLDTVFAAKTDDSYFTPLDIMTPDHMRADMPMEVGHWDDLHLALGLHTVGRFQALQQENVGIKGVPQKGLNPGFQDPFANLSILATVPGKLDVYADLYIASRPHPNTMYGHEGYMVFRALPAPLNLEQLDGLFDYINVKVGAFDIDFGDGNYHRSNNAFVERNPLIGNPLVDPNVEEIGGEAYSIQGPIYWLVGAGSGTTTEHFDYGGGASGHAKIWANPLPEVRTSASFYYAGLSGTNTTNENSDLFAASRSGGSYSAVFGGGDSPGQISPQSGKSVMAAQGDVTWNHWPFELYANGGWTEDGDTNGPTAGSPAETWFYGTVGPVYHITPALYVAGRYSIAMAKSVQGVDTNGWVDRVQVGGGYWLTRNILGKLEYVYEQYHTFGAGTGLVSGVDASSSPRFNGVVMEVSFGF